MFLSSLENYIFLYSNKLRKSSILVGLGYRYAIIGGKNLVLHQGSAKKWGGKNKKEEGKKTTRLDFFCLLVTMSEQNDEHSEQNDENS